MFTKERRGREERREGGEQIRMYSAIKATEKTKVSERPGSSGGVGMVVVVGSDAKKRGNFGLSDNSGSVSQPIVLLCLGRCGKKKSTLPR